MASNTIRFETPLSLAISEMASFLLSPAAY